MSKAPLRVSDGWLNEAPAARRVGKLPGGRAQKPEKPLGAPQGPRGGEGGRHAARIEAILSRVALGEEESLTADEREILRVLEERGVPVWRPGDDPLNEEDA